MFGGAAFAAGTALAYIDDPEQLPFDLSHVAQKALQQLDAERAHNVAIWAAVHGLLPIEKRSDPPILRTTVWGKHFSNPIGKDPPQCSMSRHDHCDDLPRSRWVTCGSHDWLPFGRSCSRL